MIHLNTDRWLSDQEVSATDGGVKGNRSVERRLKILGSFTAKSDWPQIWSSSLTRSLMTVDQLISVDDYSNDVYLLTMSQKKAGFEMKSTCLPSGLRTELLPRWKLTTVLKLFMFRKGKKSIMGLIRDYLFRSNSCKCGFGTCACAGSISVAC